MATHKNSTNVFTSSSQRVIGVKQVLKALNKDQVEKIFIADDADKHILKHLLTISSAKDIPVEKIATMMELGNMVHIAVGAAAVALLKN